MKISALKIVFTVFITLNLHLSSNGDNARDHATKKRSIETFIYSKISELQNVPDRQSLSTLANNIKNYLEFLLTILRNKGQGIEDKLRKIARDTFGDGENNNNYIKSKTLVKNCEMKKSTHK